MEELKKNIKKYAYLQLVPYALLVLVVLYVLVQALSSKNIEMNELPSLIIMLVLLGGALYWFKRDKMSLPSYWMDKIENSPEDIVWIKPVEIETKFKMVVTMAESLAYELYTIDKKVVVVHSSYMKAGLVISSFKEVFPSAHFGFSKEVKKAFRKNPSTFIDELKSSNMYHAMREYKA